MYAMKPKQIKKQRHAIQRQKDKEEILKNLKEAKQNNTLSSTGKII